MTKRGRFTFNFTTLWNCNKQVAISERLKGWKNLDFGRTFLDTRMAARYTV